MSLTLPMGNNRVMYLVRIEEALLGQRLQDDLTDCVIPGNQYLHTNNFIENDIEL